MPNRNMIGFLVLAAAIVVAIVVLAVATSGEPAPASGAVALVPGDALLYVHVSTDTSRPAVQRALAMAERFPDFPLGVAAIETRLARILSGGTSSTLDFGSQVRPWLGKEAALALLNTTTSTAGTLVVLDVRNHARARAFIEGEGATPAAVYRKTQLLRYPSGTTAAFVRHYLVLGQPASVTAAVDAAARHAPSLASSPVYRHAAAGEPPDRALDVYMSADGVRRVLAAQGGLLGALGVLLYQPALTGTTIALSPTSSGFRIRVHGALDPTLARVSGPAPHSFTPSLAGVLPQGTTLMLDVTGLGQVAPRVLGAGAEGGIAGRVGPLLKRLGAALAAEGVDVGRINALFSGETAVAVAPSAKATPGTATHGPALVIVTRTAHQAATRQFLAGLEVPLAQLFPPPSSGPGQATEFNNVPVAGITAHQLALAPGLQIDYAVFRGLVVVSTSLQAIGLVARHAHSLADAPAFGATLGGGPDHVTSLVFLDFSNLLTLAEQTGLAGSARIAALRPDLNKVRAIGLVSTRGETDTTAELTLEIR
jgi:hypothetical protein